MSGRKAVVDRSQEASAKGKKKRMRKFFPFMSTL
jgi:hypothetical protein